MVWADKTTTTGIDDIYFTRSEDGGATFRPSINLSNNPLGFSLEPKVAPVVSGSRQQCLCGMG